MTDVQVVRLPKVFPDVDTHDRDFDFIKKQRDVDAANRTAEIIGALAAHCMNTPVKIHSIFDKPSRDEKVIAE